ncbi:MAG: flagellar hook capping FlgD N-terminal domain-containing protein [Armatimonadota bacterium]|nr:flagellar hook assembly protein FlgD [bacterium]
MSTTSSVSSTGVAESSAAATRKVGSTLGQDAFLKLLITQMQNQDPLQPVDNTEYVSQLATFSSLEQMTKMNNTISDMNDGSKALSLIGTTVAYSNSSDKTATKTGTVKGVYYDNGNASLMVGSDKVAMDNIVAVYGKSDSTSAGSTSDKTA